jgi:hypothetical protein
MPPKHGVATRIKGWVIKGRVIKVRFIKVWFIDARAYAQSEIALSASAESTCALPFFRLPWLP